MKFLTALLFGLFSGVSVMMINSGKVEMATRQFVIAGSLGGIFMYSPFCRSSCLLMLVGWTREMA
jgi:hypothetical protein